MEKEHEEINSCDRNVFYVGKGLGYTGVCVAQNSLNGMLKICICKIYVYVCKFHLKKRKTTTKPKTVV